ncbi:AAA family ATPase [Bacillus inaquosorum]|uniref:AAA family ATPase n=1 Tax=Bacillus inaquosorum TaxID=483913 RepID=UPI0022819341|nr:DUF3696 domain-containing protein [Bacillus inaquosorum]MCY9057262.1 DUF3696 domain-containing protein [Bacillus inaquosorum]MCY9175943.1 DUF3696 domain-containing protein [Bacillus inaquosorum]
MITNLTINGLKSFDETSLDLNNFTLLVGMNSAGKSTVIQALLLSVQNITDDGRSPLNGRLVSLGEFSDARNFIKNAKSFSINLRSQSEGITLKFVEDDGVVKCEVNPNENELTQYLHQKNKKIHYLSSKRIGSQDLYRKNFEKYNDFGILGEYAIDYYELNKQNPVEEYLIKDKSIGSTLALQLNYWLKYIVNSELITEDIKDTDQVKAKFLSVNNRYVRPKNIGSGLSYIISILVSALTSKKGDLIIIENPEIHLHPRAQSKLTEFLTFTSENGIRFVIETHSDHIFNGVRKSINKKNIGKENVSVYFFSIDDNEMVTNSVNIKFDNNGNVINHQEGLFDQFDDDLDELLGL